MKYEGFASGKSVLATEAQKHGKNSNRVSVFQCFSGNLLIPAGNKKTLS